MGKKYCANMSLCVLLGLLVIFAVAGIGSALTPKGLFVKDAHINSVTKEMLSDVYLTQYTIVKEPDHRVKAVFYVRNNAKQDVENLSVLCEFFDKNGAFVDQKRWYLGTVFPAGEETTFAPPQERYANVGATINCSIADLKITQEPAFTLHRPEGGGHGEADAGGDGHSPKASGH